MGPKRSFHFFFFFLSVFISSKNHFFFAVHFLTLILFFIPSRHLNNVVLSFVVHRYHLHPCRRKIFFLCQMSDLLIRESKRSNLHIFWMFDGWRFGTKHDFIFALTLLFFGKESLHRIIEMYF